MGRLITSDGYREQTLKCLDTLPPFSPVLNRLLAELSSDSVSIPAVAAIMERDTVVAGNILKLVNSALYARRMEIVSVCHAATLLGIERLRNAVLGMSVTRMWNRVQHPQSFSMARFNLHSVAAAIAADLLVQRTATQYPEGAFLAGLFHDLGRLLIAVALPGQYEEIRAYQLASGRAWEECEQDVLGFAHGDISAVACERWKLPRPVVLAVGNNQSVPIATPETFSLAEVVGLASHYANRNGITIEKTETVSSEVLDPLLDEISEDFNAQYGPLTMFFK